MQIVFQPTLIHGLPRAVTLNFTDDGAPARSITMFNAVVATSADPDSGVISATVTQVDGDGIPVSDSEGVIEGTGTDPSSEDAAIKAAALAMTARCLPRPIISRASPGIGPVAGGTTVVIEGYYFVGASAVMFGTSPATSFAIESVSRISAVSPPGDVGTVAIGVTVPGGTATGPAAFAYK